MSEISQLQINNNTYDICDATSRQGLFPGLIQMFAGATLPANWLLCDGSAVSRTTYAKLYAAIGTAWGAGDGSTTFNLPDLQGRAPIGAGTGTDLSTRTLGDTVGAETATLTVDQIPAHTHGSESLTGMMNIRSGASGNYSIISTAGIVNRSDVTWTGSHSVYSITTNNPAYYSQMSIDATHEHDSVGSDQAHDNMQPSAVVNFIIYTG